MKKKGRKLSNAEVATAWALLTGSEVMSLSQIQLALNAMAPK